MAVFILLCIGVLAMFIFPFAFVIGVIRWFNKDAKIHPERYKGRSDSASFYIDD